ncbi:sugar MFS transporter [Candidatus Latescibacterota bacterium]
MIQTVALLSVFGLGIAFSILGALKLELTKRLNIDDAQFGKLISSLMFTSIFVVLAFGPIVDMFGYKPVAITGYVLGFIAIFMLISAKSYGMAVFCCVMLGIAAMCLNLGNTLIPMVLFGGKNPAAASNFGNVFFGVGAFLTPLLIGILLGKVGYRTTGIVIAFLMLAPVIIAAIAQYPALEKTGLTLGATLGSMFGLLSNPAIVVLALALFCYIGIEVTMGGFVTTYLADIGFEGKSANMVLSIFWIALMFARLINSTFITPEIGPWILQILALISMVSIGLMVVVKSKALGALFVIITGFAFGPIFPTIVGVTFSKIEPSQYGSGFGIIFAIGLLGGTSIPAVIGSMSKGKSIQKSLLIATVTAFVLFVIAFILGRV